MGRGSVLSIHTVNGCKPTGAYRVVSAFSITGKFAKLLHNGSDTVPFRVEYEDAAVRVVFPAR